MIVVPLVSKHRRSAGSAPYYVAVQYSPFGSFSGFIFNHKVCVQTIFSPILINRL